MTTTEVAHEEIQDPLAIFKYALRAPETKRQWPRRLKSLFDFLQLEGPLEEQARKFMVKGVSDHQWSQDSLMKFLAFQVKRVADKQISESTVRNYYKAAKLFCEMNDLSLNWKKISRGLPEGRKSANDRAPTMEEIRKLIEYPDRRIKPIVFVHVSSGIRIGAWDYLQWKHITPIKNGISEVIAAKVVVYAGDNEEYFTFITPEAFHAVNNWMDFRTSFGERISGESWVMRDIWQISNVKTFANSGLATVPHKLKSSGVKRLLERALCEQGIRHPLPSGVKRHEWKAAHGFRKYFKSRAEQFMKPINVEMQVPVTGDGNKS